MNKNIQISVFFLLVLILLAGCAKGDSGSSDLTLTPASVTSTPKVVKTTPLPDIDVDLEKLKGLQIHFIHPWTGETQSLLFSLVDQFNQTNEWGIHVIMDAPGSLGLLTQSVWAGIENDQSLDVVVAPVSLFLAMDEKYDLIVDLNPFVDSNKYGLDGAKITDFNQTFWGEDEVDGKRLGIPAQRTASVMIYNQTWAKELGFASIPETADEFKTQTCAANAFMRTDTDSSNDGVGGWITTTDALATMNWLYGFDVSAGKSELPLFANRAPEEAFTYLLTLLKQSCAWNSKNPLPHDYFARRQGLVYSGVMQDIPLQYTAQQRAESSDEWLVIPFPAEKDNPVVTDGVSYGLLKSDDPSELAGWLFIRWLSGQSQQAGLLETLGTLPLGGDVRDSMEGYETKYPNWKTAVETLDNLVTLPVLADWQVVRPIVEDAAWQLYKTDLKMEQIPEVLKQMDDLSEELSERYP